LKWLLLVCFAAGQSVFGLFPMLVFAIFLLDFIVALKELRGHSLLHPKMTAKAILIILLSSSLVLFVVFVVLFNSGVSVGAFVLTERAVSLIILLVILIIYPFSRFFINKKIQSAIQKRAGFTGLVAVGITGSYGKSGTKNFLGTLLTGKDYIITPGNTNTEIGVAQFVIDKLKPQTKYFIAEMGAYRTGEIKSLAKIVQPQIGILTAVGNQHLGLFGSLENIRRAKYELIDALPPNGTAIFNLDDPVCRELASKTKHCKVSTYGVASDADLRAQIIRSDQNGIEAKIFGAVPETVVQLPIVGQHQLNNVLGAILGALALGVTWEEIVKNIPNLKPEKQTMEKRLLPNGALIIDDSYNSNVNGVIAALKNLNTLPQQNKIVILTPMIELGNESESAHRLAGEILGATETQTYYTGTDFENSLLEGIKKINPSYKIFTRLNPQAILSQLRKRLNKDTVILLEGRVPKIIREELR
jgi:UDP-N-acetylmuramoyl-tripeptide--D-alanyl-D-alanine ligase